MQNGQSFSDVRCCQDSVVTAHLPPCLLHKGEDGLCALLSKLAVPEEVEASQW